MKPYFFRFILSVFVFLFTFSPVSYAGTGNPFNKIVFFGDSLSDDGNLYGTDIGFMPKSPPYFLGRFSNGYVWSEQTGTYFYNKHYTAFENYAVGGETTILHNPFNGYLPYSLTDSIADYFLHHLINADIGHTLFIIWIGSNDYLSGASDVESATNNVIDALHSIIQDLVDFGAMDFLVINLPDLSRTPYAIASGTTTNLHDLVAAHNSKLPGMVTQLLNDNSEINIHLFDLNSLFVDLLDHPDIYNQKYNTNITETSASCWVGGYTLRKMNLSANHIQQQIEEQMKAQTQTKKQINKKLMLKEMSAARLGNVTIFSPDLREAYLVSEAAAVGDLPCANPDQYVFWDHVHPTEIVHKLIAINIIDFINQNYQQA